MQLRVALMAVPQFQFMAEAEARRACKQGRVTVAGRVVRNPEHPVDYGTKIGVDKQVFTLRK